LALRAVVRLVGFRLGFTLLFLAMFEVYATWHDKKVAKKREKVYLVLDDGQKTSDSGCSKPVGPLPQGKPN